MSDNKKILTESMISQIAMDACLITEGVSSMAPVPAIMLRGRKPLTTTGVRLMKENRKLNVDLFLNVKYGANIPGTAWDVQENVKALVLKETGVRLNKVNINIQGVDFQK